MRILRIILPALALAVAWGCGGGKDRPSSAEHEAKTFLTIEGRQRLPEFAQKKGLAGLKRLLKDESSKVRMVAISALGTLRENKEATAVLIQVAEGPDAEDAHWAVIALGSQGAPEARACIEKLAESQEPRRREGACVAVYEYGDASLLPLLDTLIRDPDPNVRRAAGAMRKNFGVPRGGPP